MPRRAQAPEHDPESASETTPETNAETTLEAKAEAKAETASGAINMQLLPEPLLHPNNLWTSQFAFPPPEDRNLDNNPVVVAMTLDPVFCNIKSFMMEKSRREMNSQNNSGGSGSQLVVSSLVSNFAVVGVLSAGYAKAPYEEKPTKDAKYISSVVVDKDGVRKLHVHSYNKHESNLQYKGRLREDIVTVIQAGCTLRLSATQKLFEFDKKNSKSQGYKSFFPLNMDVIPPFTMVQISLKPTYADKLDKSDAVSIKQVKVFPLSLYSFASAIARELPASFEAQKELTEACKNFAPPAKPFVQEGDAFGGGDRPVSKYLFGAGGEFMYLRSVSGLLAVEDIEGRPGLVKLRNVCLDFEMGDSMVNEVDVDGGILLRYTNCKTLDKAKRLINIASSCGCLRLLVAKNYSNNRDSENQLVKEQSQYRGVPVIDFLKLIGIDDDFMHILEMVMKTGNALPRGDLGSKFVYYDSNARTVTVKTGRFYSYEEDGVPYRQQIIVRVDLRIREKPEVKDKFDEMEGVASDLQAYHKDWPVPRYCRVHIDLGGRIGADDREEDGYAKKDFLCMVLNLTSMKGPGSSGASADAKEVRKRSAPALEDTDVFSD